MAQGLGINLLGEAARMRQQGFATRKLFGLIELDAAGTVLYSCFEPDDPQRFVGAPDYTGLNFYTEVVPFKNVVEFRSLLDDFKWGTLPAQSIDFTCDYEDGPLPVRMLLTRISERSQTDVTKSILVHIRRAQ